MQLDIVRTLRTPYSERFILQQAGKDIGALDLHHRLSGAADGTLLVFDDAGISEAQVGELLSEIDERLLPDVSIEEGNLSFTVVFGRALGAFVAEKPVMTTASR